MYVLLVSLPYLIAQCGVTGYLKLISFIKNVAPEDGLIQSETCTAYIENKV